VQRINPEAYLRVPLLLLLAQNSSTIELAGPLATPILAGHDITALIAMVALVTSIANLIQRVRDNRWKPVVFKA
jgi:hypothetical protein